MGGLKLTGASMLPLIIRVVIGAVVDLAETETVLMKGPGKCSEARFIDTLILTVWPGFTETGAIVDGRAPAGVWEAPSIKALVQPHEARRLVILMGDLSSFLKTKTCSRAEAPIGLTLPKSNRFVPFRIGAAVVIGAAAISAPDVINLGAGAARVKAESGKMGLA